MLKGIRGVDQPGRPPACRSSGNTPREPELVEQLDARCSPTRGSPSAFAVLVARPRRATSGATDVWEAKRHTEVYHFLFEATVARASAPTSAAANASR